VGTGAKHPELPLVPASEIYTKGHKMPKGISLNACSKALGYSISTLHKHRKNGALKPLRDGSYDLEAVRKGLLQFTVPSAKHKDVLGPKRKALPQIDAAKLTDIKKLLASEGFDLSNGLTVELVRAAEGISRSHQRMFDLAIKRRQYIETRAMGELNQRITIGWRRAMENLPARVADEIAARLSCSAHDLEKEMLAAIKDVLNSLAPLKDGME
jgi:hypothetical protein